MAAWRRAVELAMSDEEIATLTTLSRSRIELASRVSRAQMLLAYRENPSFCAVGQRLGVHHQTVQRCVERALADGPLAALDDRPRPGKEPTITPEAKAWLVSLACDKAKDHGYPCGRRGSWRAMRANTGRRRGMRVWPIWSRERCARFLGREEIKPHKVRYYLENRDAEFEQKMAEGKSKS
ncbi:helix-turn-helix domain-containing protein [Bradyrhizobium sp. sBnM-33]|uniref:helix-turn-helix domain-containing protein n=1 Tax=Bradyrhizobium sp. sBnM-33 TaxID=2831780 RepID=UPI00293E4A76|nr:helix-turn-helix domain-containing protein [Bradyrhizobium sp. sBnM-33]WOH52577.1 helix-turn-helix domain-containing protein [Bradyrhizobium sp. sBnM-33]